MEPRIATLLGSSSTDRTHSEPRTLLPPPSGAPRRQASGSNDDATSLNAQHGIHNILREETSPHTQQPRQNKRQESSVPIAGVLNDEASTPNIGHAVPATSSTTLPPFSGRLSDLLLDPFQRLTDQLAPLQQHSSKRKRVDEQPIAPPLPGTDNKLMLPNPQQIPKKAPKRPRIPPLLQGLHHPPPLPEKVFPPITGEAGGFGRDIGDRVGVRSPPKLANVQEHEEKGDRSENILERPDEEAEKTKETGQSAADKTNAAVSTSDKENAGRIEKSSVAAVPDKTKETRKRNKWSEQETKDLLVGVSRFGIGNWKKILQCPDFNFSQRTAVDLKDRFRVCCPGDGLKQRKSKRKSDQDDLGSHDPGASTPVSNTSNSQDTPTSQPTSSAGKVRKGRGETDRKGPAELAEMGIHAPFTKNKRRERREFTEKDDENLLKGFERYASSWHQMRDDKELGFGSRHPTDLRDRFRIRFPEKFAKAGYKLKARDEALLKEKDKDVGSEKDKGKEKEVLSQDSNSAAGGVREVSDSQQVMIAPSTINGPAQPPSTGSANSSFRSHPLRQSLLTSFLSPLHDFGDLTSDGDADDGGSPITLSRNILQWVDSHPSQTSTSSAPTISSSFNTSISTNTENSFHEVSGSENLHIDPYSMPLTLLTGGTMFPTSSLYPSSSSQPSHHPYSHNNTINPASITPASSTALVPTTAGNKQFMDALLRTPNLPTMMYPPVPVASARSAVHNLPRPADLFSGLDLDTLRTENQSQTQISNAGTGFMVDDNLMLTFPSTGNNGGAVSSSGTGEDVYNNTLAPMVGGGMGQGIFNLDRDLLDESFGDTRRG